MRQHLDSFVQTSILEGLYRRPSFLPEAAQTTQKRLFRLRNKFGEGKSRDLPANLCSINCNCSCRASTSVETGWSGSKLFPFSETSSGSARVDPVTDCASETVSTGLRERSVVSIDSVVSSISIPSSDSFSDGCGITGASDKECWFDESDVVVALVP